MIQVYFDDYTTTYDEVERSQKATIQTMLATVGGMMGLLTGFSILSGVEIVYFAAKIFLSKLKRRKTI